jgi:hypothetical protein
MTTEPSLLLLGGPERGDDLHVAGVGCRAVEGLRRQFGAAPGDLGQGGVLQVGEPGPPSLVGEEQVPQPPGAGLCLQFLHDRRVELRVAGFGHLPVVDRLGRVDVLVHELEEPSPQVLAPIAEGELHGRLPEWRRRNRTYALCGAA